MTAINYVRDLPGGGIVTAHGHRSQALPSLTSTAAWPSGPSYGVRVLDRKLCSG